jgi:hypothetical protein
MTFDAYAYLDATAAAMDLPIPEESREAVAANLTRLEALARQVMAFEPPTRAAADTSNET